MKRILIAMLTALLFGLLICGCSPDDDEEEEDCPKFENYQIYPEVGDVNSDYEFLIQLKHDSVNHKVLRIEAKVYNSDGSYAGNTFQLVQSSADPYRFLKAFKGSDFCELPPCMLYFQTTALHSSGCEESFDSTVFVVESNSTGDDDDDDNDDNDNDNDNDNDDTSL